ncbi:extracellular serine-rich protein [Cordyceps fumosorosea ARSEF 2679]|uniref:Extracellular serine-rich protein n=1 Tax=Cordyceps fumosorosea (strain ARSEF 2679) TaxID=1081104 RepID=A0A167VVT2_CORFA|nr:extracellular serine-rich protein [Cordyceps fumosorosea ARSEF 2679]OAA63034.1 extracellular serine-rich protein [Cordyceps fumosorosea ARSEF 2679]
MKFTLASVAALMGAAQESYAAINVQVVSVGRNPVNNATGLKFWPDNIKATAGSMVQFQFLAGNHTITQSDFDHPCKPINEVNPSVQGIFSSFQPAAASAAKGEFPTYTIMVNDTKPMWFFCSQGPHCEKGMVMVINENTGANSSRSLANYKKLAAEATPEGGATQGGTPSSESSTGATPQGAASATPSTAGASITGVSSSMLLALGAVFMLL